MDNFISQQFGIPEVAVMLGLGLVVLLFGYRIKKIAFFIIWFLLGYNLVQFLMPTVNTMVPQIAGDALYQTLLPIAGGLLLALMGFSIEKICVGGICFVLVMLVAIQYFGTDMQVLAVSAIIGVIAAGAAVALMKPAIIIATSIMGAYALTLAFFSLSSSMNFGELYWPILIGLAAVGCIFQFVTTKRID